MADKSEGADEVMVQLATRIPKKLHQSIKLLCVREDISVMDFVTEALTTHTDKIRAKRKGRKGD